MKFPVGSYTFYNNYENCAYKAYRMYVAKDLPRVETPQMKRGNDVHSALEHRIKQGLPLPADMLPAEPVAAMLEHLPPGITVRVEYKLGMKQDGSSCDFFDNEVWFRGKADVAVLSQDYRSAWVVDWKTGKKREEPFELETNALLLRANHPDLQHIVAEYFWMQEGQSGIRYTLNSPATAWGKLFGLYSEMKVCFETGNWPKRKNPLCGWCDVLDCEHNTKGSR